ncbi:hypothetical protein DPEC_G00350910 [Dallia pectoralis]|uniref:Uncharacterized protein n=1 Tax=Dallia pectoralis TaxID=75939 RepID=A0ACC2F1R1_DALPE|nr:hypothetical protein DPEC_G00350910 [Dallia pectoralis]
MADSPRGPLSPAAGGQGQAPLITFNPGPDRMPPKDTLVPVKQARRVLTNRRVWVLIEPPRAQLSSHFTVRVNHEEVYRNAATPLAHRVQQTDRCLCHMPLWVRVSYAKFPIDNLAS